LARRAQRDAPRALIRTRTPTDRLDFMGQSRLHSTLCKSYSNIRRYSAGCGQPEHFLSAEGVFEEYPNWVVDFGASSGDSLGAIRAALDQCGLCAGRRAVIEGLDQGDTNECYSNIVHPSVSCVFERRQNAYCSAIRGYCLVHRCCDLDHLGHRAIAGASVVTSLFRHRPKPTRHCRARPNCPQRWGR
jgi:hypothetical protein